MMPKLSILVPSKYPEKLQKLLQSIRATVANYRDIEIVICRDGDRAPHSEGNIVYCYSPASKYRSTFHEMPAKVASGDFLMMANDDMEFVTPNWDIMIPYDQYPDSFVLFHFKDNIFDQNFACHPIFSRKVLEIAPDILSPLFQITKCDNTIWDIHPASRRIYLPDIEIIHHHENLGPEWKTAYMEDDQEYARHQVKRTIVRNAICTAIGINYKVMMAVPTAPETRRPEFYDYFNIIQRPPGTLTEFIHGPSIAHNRNIAIRSALQNNCTHLFFLDDDVTTTPDVLFQLLKHDKDIVTGVLPGKSFPHRPYLFNEIVDGHTFKYYKLNDRDKGLIPIMGSGFGVILIKTDVFLKLEEPWIRYNPYIPDQLGEDIYFFDRLRDKDVGIYCDLDCSATHYAHVGVRILWTKAGWQVVYDTAGEGQVNYPHTEQIRHLMVEEVER